MKYVLVIVSVATYSPRGYPPAKSFQVTYPPRNDTLGSCASGAYLKFPQRAPKELSILGEFSELPTFVFPCFNLEPLLVGMLEHLLHSCALAFAQICGDFAGEMFAHEPSTVSEIFPGNPPRVCPSCPSSYEFDMLQLEISELKLDNRALGFKISGKRDSTKAERITHTKLRGDLRRSRRLLRDLKERYEERFVEGALC